MGGRMTGIFPKPDWSEPAMKFDQGKKDWTLIPWGPLEDVLEVLTHGAKKYKPYNWQKVGLEEGGKARYTKALLRHVIDYSQGHEVDDDSGLPTLGHVVCCCLFLLWLEGQNK